VVFLTPSGEYLLKNYRLIPEDSQKFLLLSSVNLGKDRVSSISIEGIYIAVG
jgi:hypothetical protein